MEVGTIIHIENYEFNDGSTANKFFVLLNTPDLSLDEPQPYLAAIATTQQKLRSKKPGCDPQYSYFFIPKGRERFSDDTWLLLNDIKPLKADELLEASLRDGRLSEKGQLSDGTIRELKNCVKYSMDVEVQYKKMVIKSVG